MTVLELGVFCLEQYQINQNPLTHLRELGFNTHFELYNNYNSAFLAGNSKEIIKKTCNSFDNTVFVLLKQDDDVLELMLFFNGFWVNVPSANSTVHVSKFY